MSEVEMKCSVCSRRFLRDAHKAKYYPGSFCSRQCSGVAVRQRCIRRFVCEACGEVFMRNGQGRRTYRFCSHACAAKTNLSKRCADSWRASSHTPEATDKRARKQSGRSLGGRQLKGPTNCHAKGYCFKDASGRTHRGTNLKHFVRENEHLFDAEDVAWVSVRPHKPLNTDLTCRAYMGLIRVRNGRLLEWHGWTLSTSDL